ncbi:MAG: radical SAM protein [Desulfobacteraceae bacterium]|nr:radical SAM protein [Desulfobacteraceae bacterium]
MKETMTEIFENNKLKITLNQNGYNKYTKISFPVKYGIYSEIETEECIFQFNLNNEIVRAKDKTTSWLNPSEWLKRTIGNDWVYYSTGGYAGVIEAIGEYYLPNLQYSTNSLIGGKPFKDPQVNNIISQWSIAVEKINNETSLPDRFQTFLNNVLINSNKQLSIKSKEFFKICGRRVSVLPPDARHVDYDVIPVNISIGCLYNCRFCRVKTEQPFSLIKANEIIGQIKKLKQLYSKDIVNYNSIFLGEHDALNSPCNLIMLAAKEAYTQFNFKHSYMKSCNLFLFGSINSLLNKTQEDFKRLATLPFQIYINVGLESVDQETLDFLGKPITTKKVIEAYKLIRDININYNNIEISSNFIFDDTLPENHYSSIFNLLKKEYRLFKNKGDIYFSPLRINKPSREELYKFYRLKSQSPVPTFLYIIQRL